MHRRIHVAEIPLVSRNLPVGMGIEIPQHQQKLFLGKVEVHQRQRIVWKARSQAAYQGYSHLSGMEMMSLFSMWNHSVLRDVALAVTPPADERHAPSASDRGRNSNTAWSRASRPAPGGARDVRLRLSLGGDAIVEFVGIGEAAVE